MNWLTRNSEFEDLSSESGLQAAIDASHRGPVVLFKHSKTCGSSYLAQREMSVLVRDKSVRVYRLVVQDARDLSQQIEQTLAVRHESPQVIVLVKGRPVFHASHRRVTAARVLEAVAVSTTDDE